MAKLIIKGKKSFNKYLPHLRKNKNIFNTLMILMTLFLFSMTIIKIILSKDHNKWDDIYDDVLIYDNEMLLITTVMVTWK